MSGTEAGVVAAVGYLTVSTWILSGRDRRREKLVMEKWEHCVVLILVPAGGADADAGYDGHDHDFFCALPGSALAAGIFPRRSSIAPGVWRHHAHAPFAHSPVVSRMSHLCRASRQSSFSGHRSPP